MAICALELLEDRLCMSAGAPGFSIFISTRGRTVVTAARHHHRHRRHHSPRLVAIGGGNPKLGLIESAPPSRNRNGVFGSGGFGSIGLGLMDPGVPLPNPVGGLGAFL